MANVVKGAFQTAGVAIGDAFEKTGGASAFRGVSRKRERHLRSLTQYLADTRDRQLRVKPSSQAPRLPTRRGWPPTLPPPPLKPPSTWPRRRRKKPRKALKRRTTKREISSAAWAACSAATGGAWRRCPARASQAPSPSPPAAACRAAGRLPRGRRSPPCSQPSPPSTCRCAPALPSPWRSPCSSTPLRSSRARPPRRRRRARSTAAARRASSSCPPAASRWWACHSRRAPPRRACASCRVAHPMLLTPFRFAFAERIWSGGRRAHRGRASAGARPALRLLRQRRDDAGRRGVHRRLLSVTAHNIHQQQRAPRRRAVRLRRHGVQQRRHVHAQLRVECAPRSPPFCDVVFKFLVCSLPVRRLVRRRPLRQRVGGVGAQLDALTEHRKRAPRCPRDAAGLRRAHSGSLCILRSPAAPSTRCPALSTRCCPPSRQTKRSRCAVFGGAALRRRSAVFGGAPDSSIRQAGGGVSLYTATLLSGRGAISSNSAPARFGPRASDADTSGS